MMTVEEAAAKAVEIMEKHALAADMDAGFDAGEFSGPAHAEMEEKEIRELAEANGLSLGDVLGEVQRISREEEELNRQEWGGR